ncbi:MAG: hypothetical protein MUC58_05210 [Rhizobiaceae bacterium]|jgi:phosphonate transport system substrate-binding protein|nr:hypothetical protein [Rhizobiaceae bacterium]
MRGQSAGTGYRHAASSAVKAMACCCALAALAPTARAETAAAPVLAQETSALAAGIAPEDAAAAPDWRAEIGTFKVGLARRWSSDMSPAVLKRLEGKLGAALGLPVRVVTFDRFASLIDAQAGGAIDYAVYSARAYAAAQIACECLTIMAQPTSEAGETGQRVHLIGDPARLANLNALDGLRLGWTGENGSAAAAQVTSSLRIAGRPVTGDEPFWQDHASLDEAVAAYNRGETDGFIAHLGAGAAGTSAIDGARLAALGLTRPAKTHASSELWPYGPHAVRAALAPQARDILAGFLSRIDVEDEPLHALLAEGLGGPLKPVAADAYRPVLRAVQQTAKDTF